MSNYETVIGLEVHLQLFTRTKAFCGCRNEFGQEPNSATCPVCLGFPGSLPVLNRQYLEYAIKVALALDCKIFAKMKFDRKNYFYPDLPKNYQISQYDMPLSNNGSLEIIKEDGSIKAVRIKRVHMEEDAGKLLHQQDGASCVDFNRSGTPLLEIVTEPDINSPEEAYIYLAALKNLLRYLEVSDCDMEKGSLRCDANISIRQLGVKELGVKIELKNMNSFKGVKAALEYEEKRQQEALEAGEKLTQQTRLWDPEAKITRPMRSKEEAHDYRYFPEPDLVPFKVGSDLIEQIKSQMPQLPSKRKKMLMQEYSISDYDAGVLVSDKAMSDFFLQCVEIYPDAKAIVNWITSDILKYLNAENMQFSLLKLSPRQLTEMLQMIGEGKISGKIAKDILKEMIQTQKSASQIVNEKGLLQISDQAQLKETLRQVLKQNPKAVEDYKNGKAVAITFLVGQIMKATKGKANPGIINKLLREELQDEK
ncbi:MAG: Asp-tRNA(Asn)/Glu-tRNA(Gln) amidotransferase subunit GatB [Candidatus Omnitrophota bacterium]